MGRGDRRHHAVGPPERLAPVELERVGKGPARTRRAQRGGVAKRLLH